MATSGQTLNDRINAARYALAGQGLARCVCKATTEEVIGPKKKHLDYLLACTHEPNVSIPQLANLLIERTNHIYWVVVFKALVTVHHLMSYGNERFTQYLASSNYSFELSTFLDKTSARDFSMSTFIRKYSRYINEKALSYRLMAFDFCKVKRGSEGVLRVMPIDRLLKTLPVLQNQLDALLEFNCSASDLNNGVINACFMLLFRDLIGLFACHNDGIINLLNKYFTLNKKMCHEAFEHYKSFLDRMKKVSEFLRVAEVVGIDKDEIPELRSPPSSLIDAMEQHLQNLESNKKILKQQSNSKSTGGDFPALGNLTPPSSLSARPSSPSAATSGSGLGDELAAVTNFKDDEVRRALEEEARVLSQYGTDGSKLSKPSSKEFSAAKSVSGDNSPKFAVTTIPKSIDDIFGDADSFANNSSSDNNAAVSTAFDNLSTTSSSSSSAKNRPDLDSIKSAIRSATTHLEESNHISSRLGSEAKASGPKKASDELFSLLDASSLGTNPISSNIDPLSKLTNNNNNMSADQMSPFMMSSPFDMPNTNGQSSKTIPAPLKPGNPFPDLASESNSRTSAFPVGSPANPMAATSIQSTSNSVFKSNTPSGANYTNLGGLEGFGDLLQPMSSGQADKNQATSNNFGASKLSYNTPAGLSSTGLFKGDLDTTLANLAQNLTFEGLSKTKK